MAQATRTFRIFVSSTFPPSLQLRRTGRDLKEERNALQKYVFPRLRELCARHGCRFQAIDLRWGVREEAALDQQTMRICLEEIARCQRSTVLCEGDGVPYVRDFDLRQLQSQDRR